MSVKETLDAIDLVAARCRIWAASLLTLFAGVMTLDLFGAFNDLVPAGSVWHKIIPIVGIVIARYTHSRQSADAVIEAKGDTTERSTPPTTRNVLPAVALFLVASLGIAGCGGPNYYTISLAEDGQPWPDTNYATLRCSGSFHVPVSPTCGSNGALCSTNTQTCRVFERWGFGTGWIDHGLVNSGGLVYRPDVGPKGSYLLYLSQPCGSVAAFSFGG